MEAITLLLFCGGLILCVCLAKNILFALAFGLLLFLLYGRRKGKSWTQLLPMALSGVKSVGNILVTFLLIGMLTALWRAGGTIPAIICMAASLIRPSIFYLLAFLLNCGVSVLTGTSFGTAATMGVICMTMANTMGLSAVLSGGAVLSGVYFGDRCSPVSTSALLVSQLTGTNIFSNLKRMVHTALPAFLLSCGIYTLFGLFGEAGALSMDVEAIFSRQFQLHWFVLLPAVAILVLSAFQVNVKPTMLASILLAAVSCLWIQKIPVSQLSRLLLLGYKSADPEIAAMLTGGGILSMASVSAVVCLSSTYVGIFQGTGLLDGVQQAISRLGKRISPYGAVVCTAIAASVIACNQTLSILLTHQLCGSLKEDSDGFAIDLEDSVVVIAPMVPWSIAGAVPLASMGAPTASILAACFLYLLPLSRLAERRFHMR
ncbi:MAG: sodium:proton antiporter [Lawsonibacter sp.]|nr:sodium:proton antiporter [Lawsonibacter sp.]